MLFRSASFTTQLGRKYSDEPFAIGQAYYRNGSYCGTIVSKGADDFGAFVMTNTGVKIRTAGNESDEFFSDDDN